MDRVEVVLAIAVSAVITISLRALPFVIFHNGKTMPEKLVHLGNMLPSAIMAVLIVYCMKNAAVDFKTYGIPEVISILVVAGSYRWKRNTLLSIVLGTACNMILLHVMGV